MSVTTLVYALTEPTYSLLDATVERQTGRAVAEVGIYLGSTATTLLNTPDDERLATTTVTSGEHVPNGRRVLL